MRVQGHPKNGNLKVEVKDQATGVGARGAYASKNKEVQRSLYLSIWQKGIAVIGLK